MVLSPLAACAGDCVPDEQKGLLGGLIALSPALGAWPGALATTPGLVSVDGRLAVVARLVLLAVTPALDRQTVVLGNHVSVRADFGGRRIVIKNKLSF